MQVMEDRISGVQDTTEEVGSSVKENFTSLLFLKSPQTIAKRVWPVFHASLAEGSSSNCSSSEEEEGKEEGLGLTTMDILIGDHF